MNGLVVWLLLRVAGLHTHIPPRIARPIQGAVQIAASRSPTALAVLYDSDKGPKDHLYTGRYQQFFSPLRSQPVTLLEIGIHKGASMRMWRRYFPNATIIGVDIKTLPQIPGVHTHVGDQSDAAFLGSLTSRYRGFDIVIDDGSHVASHIRASFAALFPAVRPGGWYVIEDLETAYWDDFEGGPVGTPGTAVELVKTLVDRTQAPSGAHDIAELHVFDGIAFIRKAITA